ncbi:MAG: TRAP transporter fused permease subunit [Deltaproteobacteria bacterium]|nr:TRAP transporter fused permease subunit [Deltaproteobacteria bacterium]
MRQLTGKQGKIFRFIALVWSIFMLYSAVYPAHPIPQGAITGGFAMALCFALFPFGKKSPLSGPSPVDWVLMALAVTACGYMAIDYEFYLINPAYSTPPTILLGTILLVLIFEVARRTVGLIIPIMAATFLLYAYLGEYLPGILGHGGFSHTRIIEFLYLGTRGFWGTITLIVSLVIPPFIILGSVLLVTGGARALNDVANLVAGRIMGGAAMVAVVSSALFGTISGSSISNVATTGSFTIPMMKNLGYRKELAGAVEAAASTGGQIMPPVMGAGAFIMSEILGIPYISICLAAAIPAILYFLGVGCGIYFEARRTNLPKLPPELMPKARKVFTLATLTPIVAPVGLLLYLLIAMFTPNYAAFWAILAAIALFFFSAPWDLKARSLTIVNAFITGAHSLLVLFCLVLCIQVVVSLIGLTGVGVKVTSLIIGLSKENLFIALIITCIVSLILGMGLPTTAAYVLGAAVLGGAVVGMGLDTLAAHLFIFYYAIISVITPPVCGAVYVASGIAGSNWWKTAGIAVRLAAPAYLVPFIFVTNPALLGQGSLSYIGLSVITAIIGICSLGAGMIGYFVKPTGILERFLFIGAAVLLIKPGLVTDLLGLSMIFIAWLIQKYINGRVTIPILLPKP